MSLILGTQFSQILGTRWKFSLLLGTWIGYLKHFKKPRVTHNLCIYTLLKSHHYCDAYMNVQRNKKVHFLLCLNIGKKKLAACLLHNIDIVVVSEYLCLSGSGPCVYHVAIAAACRWGHGAIQCYRLLWGWQTQIQPS